MTLPPSNLGPRCYRCRTCDRSFFDEAAIREHQNIYQNMHKIDPEIGEHDGAPWDRPLKFMMIEPLDLVADMAMDLCDLVFENPQLLPGLRDSVRRLVLDRLTSDPARSFAFNERMRGMSDIEPLASYLHRLGWTRP